MSHIRNLELTSDWSWKQREPSVDSVLDEVANNAQWKPAVAYPSEIHVELLKSGVIPDPYLGFNENKVQWIGKVEWLYKCAFAFDADANETHGLLEFLGLDTLCDVYLFRNGTKILAADNQFQTHVVSLELSSLKPQNTLLLHFKSALLHAKSIEAEMGVVRAGSSNLGDPSRVYGPELMTCGPYRPITLKTYTARIAEVQTHALLSATNSPSLKVDVVLAGTLDPALVKTLRVVLTDPLKDAAIKSQDVPAPANINHDLVTWDLTGAVEPWWPVGYGAQRLYTVTVLLIGAQDQTLDTQVIRVGFRRVALVQEPLKEPDQYGTGTTFLFEDQRWSNWVPADNFLTTLTPARYRAWLTLLRDGNQNMVRLWGGGVYEPDVFYDACDGELSRHISHVGVYPAHDSFVASVRKEAEDNVRRLRHHPAIALFCGNNEDYQMVLQWGDVKSFPAIKIYEEVLPEVVTALTGPQPIPYHRGSPYGGKGWDTADPTIGDVHQWNIWGGKEFLYQDYVKLGGRFVSEFGIPSIPEMKTVDYWMDGAGEEQRHAQSALMAQHCRAGSFERRLAILMNENFRVTTGPPYRLRVGGRYVYNTQLMQSEAVSYAYQVWRRKWGGKGKEYTAGVLVWQLNDCWPVTSWAIADYFVRSSPLIASRDQIWGTNSSLSQRAAKLEIHCVDLKTSWTHTETHAVTLLPNQATELLSLPCPGPPPAEATPPPTGDAQFTTTHSVVVGARLLDAETGAVLARFADWPQPLRLVVTADMTSGAVTVRAERPVKGLVLSVLGDGEDVRWSDNALDIMPGDPQVVVATALAGREVAVAFVGNEKAHVA
ncbi:glycoside hydrolase [Mycena rebaudengoi]|nr:glycoside hydrolase [Mycena rebaudengoi]